MCVCKISLFEELKVLYTSEEKAYNICIDFINSRWYVKHFDSRLYARYKFSPDIKTLREFFSEELASTYKKNPNSYGVSEICWVTKINLLD